MISIYAIKIFGFFLGGLAVRIAYKKVANKIRMGIHMSLWLTMMIEGSFLFIYKNNPDIVDLLGQLLIAHATFLMLSGYALVKNHKAL